MGLFDEFFEGSGAAEANVSGVAIGVVKENWSAEHPGMLKVEISLGAAGRNLTDWAPVAVPYAGAGCGTYFLPEIGTEVLVAFHMGDINCPIVIGCMWNREDTLPQDTAREGNPVKTIRTKGGNEIRITEESGKETISVQTSGKQKLLLDDENGKISLQDENGENAIVLDTKNGEMEFICKKKAVFRIDGNEMLTLDGGGQSAELKTGNVRVDASRSLTVKGQTLSADGASTEIKGQNIKIESQAVLGLKGSASLKAESSGIAEVSGAMVKIN